jgi:hypothetical protein
MITTALSALVAFRTCTFVSSRLSTPTPSSLAAVCFSRRRTRRVYARWRACSNMLMSVGSHRIALFCITPILQAVVGILGDEADPMVSVMKVEKAPMESYADIGGLEKQVSTVFSDFYSRAMCMGREGWG